MLCDVNVVYCDMPTTVSGFVRENLDDSRTIVLNSRLSYEAQLRKYKHETRHLKRGDLDSLEDVQQIELEAHN